MADPTERPIDPLAGYAFAGWNSQPEQQMLGKDDDPDDEDDDDLEDDDDPDDDDDEDEDPDDVKAERDRLREALKKANGQSAKSRARRKQLQADLDDANAKLGAKPKPKRKTKDDEDDDEPVDVDAITKAAEVKAQAAADKTVIESKVEVKLVSLGVTDRNASLLIGQLDHDDLSLDGRTVDGLDEEIERLRAEYPDMFPKARTKRRVAGEDDRGDAGERRAKPKTATEKQAAQLSGH